jgi:hypothetical protein
MYVIKEGKNRSKVAECGSCASTIGYYPCDVKRHCPTPANVVYFIKCMVCGCHIFVEKPNAFDGCKDNG